MSNPSDVSNQKQPPRKKSELREYLDAFLTALFVALAIKAFVIEAFKIPSGSMIPTLLIGDHLFVNKFIYGLRVPWSGDNKWFVQFHPPNRGEVVVFVFPNKEPIIESKLEGAAYYLYALKPYIGATMVKKVDDIFGLTRVDYIKRVVGIPGGRISFKNHELMVNGVKVATYPVNPIGIDPQHFRKVLVEKDKSFPFLDLFSSIPYFKMDVQQGFFRLWSDFNFFAENIDNKPHWVQYEKNSDYASSKPDFDELVVPPGMLFVMGDNRDHSADSRFWGFAPIDNLKGKAMFIWLSLVDDNYGNAFLGVRWERFGKWIH